MEKRTATVTPLRPRQSRARPPALTLRLEHVDASQVEAYVCVLRMRDGSVIFPFDTDGETLMQQREAALAFLQRAIIEIGMASVFEAEIHDAEQN